MDNTNFILEPKPRQESQAVTKEFRQDFLSAELSRHVYRHPDALVELGREDEIWLRRVVKATVLR